MTEAAEYLRARDIARLTGMSVRTARRWIAKRILGLTAKSTSGHSSGVANYPHLFRSCLATSTAIYHGAEIGLAMTVLDHRSSEVFERSYNQAKMIDVVKPYQEILLANPQG